MTKICIETIPILPFGMLNAFLIIGDGKVVLVDTGLPHSEARIYKLLKKHGLDWSHISAIVLTHAHVDHAGSAVAVQALTSAPVIAHEREIPYCQGEPPIMNATGMFGRLFYKTGAILEPFPCFTPDIPMVTTELSLAEFGFPTVTILHTPGHTPGSVSVLLDDGRVIAGDLAASGILLGGIVLRKRPKRPPFEESPHHAATSLGQLLSRGGETFYIGHGGPLSTKAITVHITALRKLNPVSG